MFGGTSATSSRFAFINNTGTSTPVASISANNGSNATFLTGGGVFGTTNAQSLTLGGSTTGNIVIDSGTGLVSILDATNIGGNTNITGNVDTSGTFTSGTADAFQVDSNGNITTSGTTGLTFSSTGGLILNGGTIVDNTDGVDINDDLEVTGTLTLLGATTDITTGANENLTLLPNGTGNLVLSSDFDSSVFIGSATTPSPLSISGGIGSNASLVVNQLNSGDILSASSSGITRFAIANDGVLRLYGATSGTVGIRANATASNNTLTLPTDGGAIGQALITDGSGNLSWSNVATGFNPWDSANGSIYAKSGAYDLLIGGTSTESATFAILNNSIGNTVASLSARTNGNGISLSSENSTIQSLNKNTLTLGGSTTGNIVIDSGTGEVTLGS